MDVFGEVGLMSGRVRRGRLSVGTCSTRTDKCRDVSGDVGLVSGCVRRCLLIIVTCSEKSG